MHHISRSLVRKISTTAWNKTPMTKDEFVEIARTCDAYWIHGGDPLQPHAELTSGYCSNGYLNLMQILQHSNLSQILARELLNTSPRILDQAKIHWVIGSACSATGIAKDVANILNVAWAPLEKNTEGEQICRLAHFRDNETVLHVEDLFTTGKSALSAHKALLANNEHINIIPYLPVIAHRRSMENVLLGRLLDQIHPCPLFYFNEIWSCPQDACTLCATGSKRLKPKIGNNWQLLHG